jgi:hypothetical protein
MKFNHLIQINDPLDPLDPLVEPLTRAQLWRGLVMRAEAPRLFMEHLDDCRIFDKTPDGMSRELRYGNLSICDTVTFLPLLQAHYQVPAQGEIGASSMRMRIEEPAQDVLFVRFDYDIDQPEDPSGEEAFYNEFRRTAYQEADIDTIRVIRELAAAGKLG